MTKLAIIEAVTGAIAHIVDCPPSQMENQVPVGYFGLIVGDDVQDGVHYFKAGSLREYPPKPFNWSQFDYVSEEWFDPRTDEQKLAHMAAKRTEALKAVEEWINTFLALVTGPIPVDEKLLWAQKAVSARAVLADMATADDLAILTPEATVRGITVGDLATRVVTKSAMFTMVASAVAGVRDNTWEAIKAAVTEEELGAALLAAKTQALSLAAQMGLGA